MNDAVAVELIPDEVRARLVSAETLLSAVVPYKITLATLGNWRRTGVLGEKLRVYRIGPRIMYDPHDLHDFLNRVAVKKQKRDAIYGNGRKPKSVTDTNSETANCAGPDCGGEVGTHVSG